MVVAVGVVGDVVVIVVIKKKKDRYDHATRVKEKVETIYILGELMLLVLLMLLLFSL